MTERSIVLACALLIASSTRSQDLLELTDQRHDIIHVYAVQRSATGNWLVRGYENNENGVSSQPFVQVLSPSGEVINTSGGGIDMESHSIGLVFTIQYHFCDLGSYGTYLTCRTETGDLVYSEEIIDPADIQEGFYAEHMAKGTTDRLALIADDITALVSLNAQVLGAWNTPIPNVRGSEWVNASALVMWNASQVVRVEATSGNAIPLPITGAIQDALIRNDSILVLTTHDLHIYDASGAPLTSLVISENDSLVELLGNDDALWVRTTTGAVELDASFTPSSSFTFDLLPGQVITGALLEEDRIVTAGDIPHLWRRTGLIREYTIDGMTTSHETDVELGLAVDSIRHPGSSPYSFYFRATLSITNRGNTELNEVFVNHQRGQSITCGIEGTSRTYTGLNLQPGETAVRVIPSVLVGPWAPPGGGPDWAEVLCFLALAPNSVVDRNMDDNYSCATIDLDSLLPTGITDRMGNSHITIGPNPTVGECTIRGIRPGGSGLLEVRDVLGQVLESRQRTVHADGTLMIDLGPYPAGRYMIMFRDGAQVEHIVVVRLE
jgi:hypothetical protein